MRIWIGRIISGVVVAAGWLLFGARTVLDLVGYSTFPEDTTVALGRVGDFLDWLFSIPWWALLSFALVASLWLMWVSWPRNVALPSQAVTQQHVDLLKQKRLLDKQQRRMVDKPLTPHAVERKLKVIDHALDLLKEVQPLVDRGPALLRDPWHSNGESLGVVTYAALVRALIADIGRFAMRIDALRNDNQEYQDVMLALQQTYYNTTMQELSAFAQGCEDATKAVSEGAKMATIYHPMVGNHVGRFEQALKRFGDWRNKARSDLADIRNELSPA